MFAWLRVPAIEAAPRLLGCELVRELDGELLRVRIVETEAYDHLDEASHTFHGETARNAAMFLDAGHLYVYFTYGMHHCLNVVCDHEGVGAGVLIRAVEPIAGLDVMERRRGMSGVLVTNGPGKICQALGVDLTLTGHDLAAPPIRLHRQRAIPQEQIVVTQRIGVARGVDSLRRYFIAGNRYVSKGGRA